MIKVSSKLIYKICITIPKLVLYTDSVGEMFDFLLEYEGDSSKLSREEWLFPLLLLADSESRPRNYKQVINISQDDCSPAYLSSVPMALKYELEFSIHLLCP